MDNKKRLFEFLESNIKGMIELETILTAIPALSPESGGDGEGKKATALKAWLERNGFGTVENYPSVDPRVPGGERPNLVATVEGNDPEKRFWIMSHLDVVPPGELSRWNTDPYTAVVNDGRIYGRGVEDNQQGLTSSVFTALAFLKTGIKPNRTLKLLFVSDEEMGSDYGIKYVLEHYDLFRKDDVFIVPDGGRPDGTMIEVAEKHLFWLKIHTVGKQCHASRPDQGKNAFLAASELAVRLGGLSDEYPAVNPLFEPPVSTFSPTKKEANVPNVNTIPGDDVFYLDSRILPSYKVDDVFARIKAHAADIEKKHGVTVSFETVQRNESLPTSEKIPLVKKLAAAVKEIYGTDAEAVGVGGGTVAAFLRNEGHDAVVWSRMDETAHMPNEYVLLDNLKGDAKVMVSLALEL